MSAATSRQNSLYVSDRPEDEQAAQRVGVPFPFQWACEWTCATSNSSIKYSLGSIDA